MSLSIENNIRTVVESIQDDNGSPFYLQGHKLEMSNRLSKKERNRAEKFRKYPLIAFNEMHNPLPERRGNVVDWRLNIAILARTKPEYWSEDRDSEVFEPILEPLYDKFIKALRDSGLFFWSGEQDAPPHEVVKRKYYGVTSPNGNKRFIFPDPLDAIELIDLELSQEIC